MTHIKVAKSDAEIERCFAIMQALCHSYKVLSAGLRRSTPVRMMRRLMGKFIGAAYQEEGIVGIKKMLTPFFNGGEPTLTVIKNILI